MSHGDHVIVHVWDVQCRDCASCLEKWEITVSPSPRAEPEVDNIQSGKPKTKMQIAFPRIPSNHSHPAPECTSQKLSGVEPGRCFDAHSPFAVGLSAMPHGGPVEGGATDSSVVLDYRPLLLLSP